MATVHIEQLLDCRTDSKLCIIFFDREGEGECKNITLWVAGLPHGPDPKAAVTVLVSRICFFTLGQ